MKPSSPSSAMDTLIVVPSSNVIASRTDPSTRTLCDPQFWRQIDRIMFACHWRFVRTLRPPQPCRRRRRFLSDRRRFPSDVACSTSRPGATGGLILRFVRRLPCWVWFSRCALAVASLACMAALAPRLVKIVQAVGTLQNPILTFPNLRFFVVFHFGFIGPLRRPTLGVPTVGSPTLFFSSQFFLGSGLTLPVPTPLKLLPSLSPVWKSQSGLLNTHARTTTTNAFISWDHLPPHVHLPGTTLGLSSPSNCRPLPELVRRWHP